MGDKDRWLLWWRKVGVAAVIVYGGGGEGGVDLNKEGEGGLRKRSWRRRRYFNAAHKASIVQRPIVQAKVRNKTTNS